jgi:hypothetical protein
MQQTTNPMIPARLPLAAVVARLPSIVPPFDDVRLYCRMSPAVTLASALDFRRFLYPHGPICKPQLGLAPPGTWR